MLASVQSVSTLLLQLARNMFNPEWLALILIFFLVLRLTQLVTACQGHGFHPCLGYSLKSLAWWSLCVPSSEYSLILMCFVSSSKRVSAHPQGQVGWATTTKICCIRQAHASWCSINLIWSCILWWRTGSNVFWPPNASLN